jgi:hypothetical protein
MEESRRRFLHHMTALSAIGGASAAFGNNVAGAQESNRLIQAQPSVTSLRKLRPVPCRAYT